MNRISFVVVESYYLVLFITALRPSFLAWLPKRSALSGSLLQEAKLEAEDVAKVSCLSLNLLAPISTLTACLLARAG